MPLEVTLPCRPMPTACTARNGRPASAGPQTLAHPFRSTPHTTPASGFLPSIAARRLQSAHIQCAARRRPCRRAPPTAPHAWYVAQHAAPKLPGVLGGLPATPGVDDARPRRAAAREARGRVYRCRSAAHQEDGERGRGGRLRLEPRSGGPRAKGTTVVRGYHAASGGRKPRPESACCVAGPNSAAGAATSTLVECCTGSAVPAANTRRRRAACCRSAAGPEAQDPARCDRQHQHEARRRRAHVPRGQAPCCVSTGRSGGSTSGPALAATAPWRPRLAPHACPARPRPRRRGRACEAARAPRLVCSAPLRAPHPRAPPCRPCPCPCPRPRPRPCPNPGPCRPRAA
jgi:hypothetical protein